MPKAYSCDLRERVIEAVEAGASRREAAERFAVSVASAIKWLQRWHESKSVAPKPRGGGVSPLEEFAAEVLAVIAEQPDLTLVETVAELRKRRIRTSRSSLWRFLDRHNITLKKSLQAAERQRADVVPQGGHERDCLPGSERNVADHPDATRSASPEPCQIRADRRLVEKHQPGGIKHALLSYPTSARSRHVRSLPFGSLQAFF